MEKITLVETFKLSEEEIAILGKAVNTLADITDFVCTEAESGVKIELPEQLVKILDIFKANLEALNK